MLLAQFLQGKTPCLATGAKLRQNCTAFAGLQRDGDFSAAAKWQKQTVAQTLGANMMRK
ncbi:hypothetical protein [Novosphingobium sp. Leaf2]|uniref:hypothetical protein n=1 Tax=Novosphingobium sp. Leaf2 TaxID=1735670 RepID=UPI002E12E046